jgi:hypothetical protein
MRRSAKLVMSAAFVVMVSSCGSGSTAARHELRPPSTTLETTSTTTPVTELGGVVARVEPVQSAQTSPTTGVASSPAPTSPHVITGPAQGGDTSPSTTPQTAGACTASVSSSTPNDGGTETVNVSSNVARTPLEVTAHYKTTDSTYAGTTNGAGSASVTFDIGHPTAGYTVRVDININGNAACSTEFTPQ